MGTTRRVNERAVVCGIKGLQTHALGRLLGYVLVLARAAEFNSSASTPLLTTALTRDAMWLASGLAKERVLSRQNRRMMRNQESAQARRKGICKGQGSRARSWTL